MGCVTWVDALNEILEDNIICDDIVPTLDVALEDFNICFDVEKTLGVTELASTINGLEWSMLVWNLNVEENWWDVDVIFTVQFLPVKYGVQLQV